MNYGSILHFGCELTEHKNIGKITVINALALTLLQIRSKKQQYNQVRPSFI